MVWGKSCKYFRRCNSINDIYSKGYDYIEMMEVIYDSLELTMDVVSEKSGLNEGFRSYTTGYSFFGFV